MITKTSAEAQNQFGQLLDTVQREPVVITRHGRVAAVVVSPRDMEELEAARGAAQQDCGSLGDVAEKGEEKHEVRGQGADRRRSGSAGS